MQDIVKPGLVLLLITAVAAMCLGFVYDITKEPIRIQQEEATAASLRVLLPEATEFKEDITVPDGANVVSAYTAYNGADPIGYVFGVAPKGYSGAVNMLVGVTPEGTVAGVNVVSQTETPGLGTNCEKQEFRDGFKDQTGPFTVVKSGNPGENEIQAMTSSTITTNAVVTGVNDALSFYNEEVAK